MAGPRQEQMKSAIKTTTEVKANSTNTTSLLRFTGFNSPLLIALASILLLITLTVIILVLRRRRQSLLRSNRAFGIRRGLNFADQNDDDEEDLLISSLYS